MPKIIIKNREYNISLTKDSFSRRAVQYTNNIYDNFRRIGLSKDDVDVSEERIAIKRAPASVSWWIDHQHCFFSCNKESKYVDNLLIVSKVIEFYVYQLENEEITPEEFIELFRENKDVSDKRAKAREFFELDENHVDLQTINKKYKLIAKDLHPDMPTGDHDKFKELNEHHKVLKRELE